METTQMKAKLHKKEKILNEHFPSLNVSHTQTRILDVTIGILPSCISPDRCAIHNRRKKLKKKSTNPN